MEDKLKLIKKNGIAIKNVHNQTFELKEAAIRSNPLAVEYINELEEELGILAVKILWNSLKLIKNPTDNVKREAILSKGWAIQYIESPSEELQLLAVENDYDAIKYIKNPSEIIQLRAIEKHWGAIKFINNPSIEVKRVAIKKNEESINFIQNYDLDEIKIFIQDNINIVKYIYDSIEVELVVDILVEKLKVDDISEEYVKDFFKLEILDMDKIKLMWDFGSKRVKRIVVDYILGR